MTIDVDETVSFMNQINAEYWQTITTYKDGRKVTVTIQLEDEDEM